MRHSISAITALLLTASSVQAQTLSETGAYAIVDVRAEVGDGHTMDRTTILLRDGLIQAIGPDLKIPADAEVILGKGLIAYPGFIDAGCTRGLKLPEWQPDQDHAPDTSALAPASMRVANRKWVRPELKARDYLSLTQPLLASMRRDGFCVALFAPASGIITGVSALVDLNGMPRRDSLIRGSAGMHMAFSPSEGGDFMARFSPGAGTGYPASLLGIIADLRQTLLDAGRHTAAQAGYERAGGPRPPFDDCMDALQPALDGAMPVIFAADSKNEIDRAMRLADEFHLRLILTGAGDAWKDAPVLARRGIPVLASLNFGDEPGAARQKPPVAQSPPKSDRPDALTSPAVPPPPGSAAAIAKDGAAPAVTADDDDTPQTAKDEQHRKWSERVANTALLEKAGVPFALVSSGLKNPADFWKNLRRAIKDGLPKPAALRAITLNPAKILGVDRQMGTLQAGKMANVVLMTGDFAEPSSRVKYLIIDKSRFEPDAETTSQPPPPPFPGPMDMNFEYRTSSEVDNKVQTESDKE